MKTNTTHFILAALAFAWLAFPSTTRAVSPPPDGGYPDNNTAEGESALNAVDPGFGNTAVGYQALFNNLASFNTATGHRALLSNSHGIDNTATGGNALENNTMGNFNTATGVEALLNNTTAKENTASGYHALLSNTTGEDNTATGVRALQNNRTANANTATGVDALASNMTGADNTAMGASAMALNRTGFNNTAAGFQALFTNNDGFNNSANGVNALFSNTHGFNNTADGFTALQNNTSGNSNTAVGDGALAGNTSGSNNIGVGISAGLNLTTGSNNIDVGANVVGKAGEANTIRIGKQGIQKSTLIAGVAGTPISGSTVVVNSTGKLGVATSSARFKEAINPMDKASEAILALKPVTFRYKEAVDPDRAPQFGLVAEDVEKVDPDLVIRDEDGKVMSVRYEAVNAMLLNEFLKEHHKVQEQEKIIALQRRELESRLTQQERKLRALSELVQQLNETTRQGDRDRNRSVSSQLAISNKVQP